MNPETTMRLCEQSPTLDASWQKLYEGAFPEGEREPVEKLERMVGDGRILYHRTLDETGELLCFTLVTLGKDFAFLAYMATNPARRSGGIGSRHLSQLIAVLKQQYPHYSGLFLEIEATAPTAITLTADELALRTRRKTFYERIGARVMCEQGIYLTPSYTDRDKEWEGELLGIEFNGPVCQETLSRIIRSIYHQMYQLSHDHPMVSKVLTHFATCAAGCHPSHHENDACHHEELQGHRGVFLLIMRLRAWLQELYSAVVRKLFG